MFHAHACFTGTLLLRLAPVGERKGDSITAQTTSGAGLDRWNAAKNTLHFTLEQTSLEQSASKRKGGGVAPVRYRFCTQTWVRSRRLSSGEARGQARLCLDRRLLRPVTLRSAGTATSVLQRAGTTATASSVTVALRSLVVARSNDDATQISSASECERRPHLTPERRGYEGQRLHRGGLVLKRQKSPVLRVKVSSKMLFRRRFTLLVPAEDRTARN